MNRHLHGGNVWTEKQINNAKLIDFSSNINPFGISANAKAAIIKNINNVSRYPEPDSINLVSSLAKYHNISPDNIAVGNGSIELIYLLPSILSPKKTLIVNPTFSEYEYTSRINNSKIIFLNTVKENGLEIDVEKLGKLIPQVDLLFLNNPNNPTGTYIDSDKVIYLSKLCKEHETYLILDEAFIDFVLDYDSQLLIEEAIKNKYFIILRSLTKFFSIPGLRLGYAVSHKSLISKIKENQYPWNINLFAQIAGKEVICNIEYFNRCKKLILKEKKYLFDSLSKIKGLIIYSGAANFILCEFADKKIASANILCNKLLEKQIMIRNCVNFRGLSERFFRVAVKRRAENRKLIKELRVILIG